MKKTNHDHLRGELAHYNDTLLAIGGGGTFVELLNQPKWDEKIIPSIPIRNDNHRIDMFRDFTTITLTGKSGSDVLFVIGSFHTTKTCIKIYF